MQRTRVDLPEPESPMMTKISPASIASETSWTAPIRPAAASSAALGGCARPARNRSGSGPNSFQTPSQASLTSPVAAACRPASAAVVTPAPWSSPGSIPRIEHRPPSSLDQEATFIERASEAALLVINSEDDERDPPDLDTVAKGMVAIGQGEVYVIPASVETSGHGTTGSQAALYADRPATFLAGVRRCDARGQSEPADLGGGPTSPLVCRICQSGPHRT